MQTKELLYSCSEEPETRFSINKQCKESTNIPLKNPFLSVEEDFRNGFIQERLALNPNENFVTVPKLLCYSYVERAARSILGKYHEV